MPKEYDPLEMQFDGDRHAKQHAGNLRFLQWLYRNNRCEVRTPQTPLPKTNPAGQGSSGEFFNRRRK